MAVTQKSKSIQARLCHAQEQIRVCSGNMEKGKSEIIELLNNRGNIKSRVQKYDTMREQINIQKAGLVKRRLQRKSEEADYAKELARCEKELLQTGAASEGLQKEIEELTQREAEWGRKLSEERRLLEMSTAAFHKKQSR